MSEFKFTPKVDATQEFIEIANDFSNPLDIVREAISNSFDAKATKIEIHFSTENEYGNRILKIRLFDDGEGMDNEMLQAFFDLGNSPKRETRDTIGEKGHGTKVYFNSSEIKVTTAKNGKLQTAIMEEPYKKLYDRKLPEVIGNEVDTDPNEHFTEIIIKGYNQNQSARFTHEELLDYVMWFTKFGSVEKKFKINENEKVTLSLKGLNKDSPEEYPFGHLFPQESDKLDELLDKYNVTAPDYYCKHILKTGHLKNYPEIMFQAIFSIEGNKVKQNYNSMIRRPGKSRISGDYTVQERYGLWICKDFIPIQKKNEWISHKGSEYTKFHAFFNCQALRLTANRGSIENTPSAIMRDIESEVRSLYDDIIKSTDWQNITYLEDETDAYKTIESEKSSFNFRIKKANAAKIADFRGIELVEPARESGVFSLFIQLSTIEQGLFPFKVLDYDTHQGIDIIAVSNSETNLNHAKKFYVEFKHVLNKNLFNHSFENTHSIVCWDISLQHDDEIKDIKGESRIVQIISPLKDGEYTKYFLDNIRSQRKIEVFVLKYYLHERLKLQFSPRTINQVV